jgi:exosortase/archaeosortase family protein
VSAAVEVLGWLGIPVLQHGNVMEVAGGEVGVDEACSGIRSFQATLMIALFLGEVHRLSRLRRTAAVLAGFLYSFLFNLVRTTLLTAVAARKGITAVAAWHDPAGVTILVGCFLMLWLTTVWLGRQRKDPKGGGGNANDIVEPTTLRPAPGPGVRAFPVRWAAIALVAWLIMVEVGTQTWFRLHETNTLPQKSWSVSISDPDSGLTREDVPASISRQFRADEGLEAHGRDSAADYWQLFYFRWFPSRSLHERVAVQLAKTHGPEVCLPAMGMTMDSDLGIITVPVGGRTFAFHQYTFLAAGQKIHVFYAIYEDQTGSAALASRRQDTRSRVAAALAGSRNHGQQYLELAVNGPADPEAARVELGNELARIIVNE